MSRLGADGHRIDSTVGDDGILITNPLNGFSGPPRLAFDGASTLLLSGEDKLTVSKLVTTGGFVSPASFLANTTPDTVRAAWDGRAFWVFWSQTVGNGNTESGVFAARVLPMERCATRRLCVSRETCPTSSCLPSPARLASCS